MLRISVGQFVIERSPAFIAIKPFASRYEWEVHILPLKHDPQYIDYMPMTKEDEESTHLDYYDLKEGKKIKSSSLDKIYTEMPRIMWGVCSMAQG